MPKTFFLPFLFLVFLLPATSTPDSLVIIPPNPTLSDSIKFTVIIPSPCCCNGDGAGCIYDSTMVSKMGDTAILIYNNYKYFLGVCIDTGCSVCGKNYLYYKIPPMNEGKYTVYKIDLLPSTICTGSGLDIHCSTTVYYAADTIEEGKFSVSTTAIISKPLATQKFKSDNKGCIYDIRGRMLSSTGSISQKYLSGVYYLRIGNNLTKKVILNK